MRQSYSGWATRLREFCDAFAKLADDDGIPESWSTDDIRSHLADMLYDHQPLMLAHTAGVLGRNLAALRDNPEAIGEFFKIYVDLPEAK